MSRSTRSSALPCALVGVIAIGLGAAVYGFAVGTAAGREVDAYLLRHGSHGIVELIGDTLVLLVAPVAALGAPALAWIAWRAGRRGDAVRAVGIVAGAAIAARVAKTALQHGDPLGTEAARRLGPGFFPSGHAATVMALCLAALLVTPSPRSRLPIVAGVYASLLGFAISAGRSHHLSDVIGAFLLATAVAALALVGRAPAQRPRRGARLEAKRVAKVIAGLIAGILVLEAWSIIGKPDYLPGLAATAAVVSAFAFMLLAGYERLLEHTEQRAPGSAGGDPASRGNR